MSTSSFSVAVVCGGPSSEAAVSRASAKGVADALRTAGHRVTTLELDRNLPAALGSSSFDVVFPVTHGALGEDGCLQGMLEVLDIPYVGSGVLASATAMSKPHAKLAFRAANLPIAADYVVTAADDLTAAAKAIERAVGSSVVIKPATGGSAIGVERVTADAGRGGIMEGLTRVLAIDSVALVEQMRVGEEVSCGILENDVEGARALPPTLIMPRAAGWYDFKSRYAKQGSEHRCPAPFDGNLLRCIQDAAVGAHKAVGARDLSRVDFVVNPDGEHQ